MNAHFVVSEVEEHRQAADFSLRFGVILQRIPQGPGVTGDFLVTQTEERTQTLENALGYPLLQRRIEFKSDNASKRTKNFYVEFEQTCDGWGIRYPSGHEKAINDGCVLVISSGKKTFVFNEESFEEFKRGTIMERTTQYRKNGNAPEAFTRGYIIPVRVADATANAIYDIA